VSISPDILVIDGYSNIQNYIFSSVRIRKNDLAQQRQMTYFLIGYFAYKKTDF
jgi:hypothetical protein